MNLGVTLGSAAGEVLSDLPHMAFILAAAFAGRRGCAAFDYHLRRRRRSGDLLRSEDHLRIRRHHSGRRPGRPERSTGSG